MSAAERSHSRVSSRKTRRARRPTTTVPCVRRRLSQALKRERDSRCSRRGDRMLSEKSEKRKRCGERFHLTTPKTSSKSFVAKAQPTTSLSSSGNKCVIRAHVRFVVDLADVDVASSFTAKSSFYRSKVDLVRPQKLIGGDRVDGY